MAFTTALLEQRSSVIATPFAISALHLKPVDHDSPSAAISPFEAYDRARGAHAEIDRTIRIAEGTRLETRRRISAISEIENKPADPDSLSSKMRTATRTSQDVSTSTSVLGEDAQVASLRRQRDLAGAVMVSTNRPSRMSLDYNPLFA